MVRILVAVAVLALVACEDSSGGGEGALDASAVDSGPPITNLGDVGREDAAPLDAWAGPVFDAGPDTGPIRDAGDIVATDGGPRDQGCTAVDILVVIDSSGSMVDNQRSVAASFPGFVDRVRQRLSFSRSYHIGVATTSRYPWNGGGCTDIGDLITETGGPEAGGEVCGPYADGFSFMTEREPDLLQSFSCAARVGGGGDDDEMTMRAVLNAVSPEKNAMGGCNEGFLRQDSLLVIIMLTDEDDVRELCEDVNGFEECESYGSGGDKNAWYDELVAARGGSDEGIVVISILGRRGDNACGAVAASRLIGFTNLFGENGHLGDVCLDSYDSVFEEALPIVEDACSKR